jgi:hypothetical protein
MPVALYVIDHSDFVHRSRQEHVRAIMGGLGEKVPRYEILPKTLAQELLRRTVRAGSVAKII